MESRSSQIIKRFTANARDENCYLLYCKFIATQLTDLMMPQSFTLLIRICVQMLLLP